MMDLVKTASELDDDSFHLILDSQEIQHLCKNIGSFALRGEDVDEITGAIVSINDGDYDEVWLTTSPRPYENSTAYFKAAV